MPENNSPLVVLFICANLLSLFLLSVLIFFILNSGSYITKWTLFQLCVCTFILELSSVSLVMVHGIDLKDKMIDSPLCIIQNKIITFIYFPLKIFPAILYIYLWFAVARFNYNLEQKCFWFVSGIIWISAIIINAYDLMINNKKKDWGVQPGQLYCTSIPSEGAWLNYIIPTSMFTFVSIIVTGHSGFVLWNRWRNFNNKQNRRTAIDLGYAVRLTVLSAFYSIILLSSIIPSIIMKVTNAGGKNIGGEVSFLDFAPSIYGTILFMIFGTTKSAAIFLPCCYYVPPDEIKQKKLSCTKRYSVGPPSHESIELGHEPIELDVIIGPPLPVKIRSKKSEGSEGSKSFESSISFESFESSIILGSSESSIGLGCSEQQQQQQQQKKLIYENII